MVKIYSIKQIAGKLGVSVKTIRRLAKQGIIELSRTKTNRLYCTNKDIRTIYTIYWGQ